MVPIAVDRAEVMRLLDAQGAQLVEVLPRQEYDEEHLDAAVHLALKDLNAASSANLDPNRPVIVYCWDGL